MIKNNNFSLVLSGGSALGIGHLGVIKYLEENNLKPKEIVGTSMGALIGAAYASSMNYEEIGKIFKKINYLNLLKPNMFNTKSFIKVDNIKKFLEEIFKENCFKNLNINLKIIATNVNTADAVVFDKNSNISLIDALCATFAIPSIFEPYKIDDKYFWDGYLSSNLPLEFSSYKKIVAVDVLNLKLIKNTKFNSINLAIKKSFFISILNQTKQKLNYLKTLKNIQLIDLDLSEFNLYDFHKWEKISNKGYLDFSKSFKKFN